MNNKYKNTKLKDVYYEKHNNHDFLFTGKIIIGEILVIILFVIIWRIKIKNDYKKKKMELL